MMINVVSGHAVYTASWTAARADVHSQQRFFCLMEEGEVIKMDIWQDIGSNPGEGVVLKTILGTLAVCCQNHGIMKVKERSILWKVTADQCHRGYTLASDSSDGLMSLNPLYIRLCLCICVFCVLVSLYSSLTKSDQECSWCERTLHGPGWLWLRQLWKVLRSKLWRMLATIL